MIEHRPTVARSTCPETGGRTFGPAASGKRLVAIQIVLALWAALFLVVPAHAQRTITTGDATVSLPTMAVPRDKAVNSTLPGGTANVGWSTTAGTACTITKAATVSGTLVPGYTNVYRTSNPGIGVRFGMTQGTFGSFVSVPLTESISLPTTAGSYPLYRGITPIIVGPVSSGTVSSLPSMTITFSGPCITTTSTTTTILPGAVITAQTCNVTSGNITVNLPAIPALQLAPVGTTAGDTNFSITTDCALGGTANVYATLTDATNVANRTSNLTLNATSTVQGVNLRILRSGTPVAFGPDSAVAGTTNQFLVGVANSTSSIPFTAQYISTGSVVPGSVKATATFTMSYQ